LVDKNPSDFLGKKKKKFPKNKRPTYKRKHPPRKKKKEF
jgi:hypothetical protein